MSPRKTKVTYFEQKVKKKAKKFQKIEQNRLTTSKTGGIIQVVQSVELRKEVGKWLLIIPNYSER